MQKALNDWCLKNNVSLILFSQQVPSADRFLDLISEITRALDSTKVDFGSLPEVNLKKLLMKKITQLKPDTSGIPVYFQEKRWHLK